MQISQLNLQPSFARYATAPVPQQTPATETPEDKVEVGGSKDPLNFVEAHGQFLGSLAGAAIGLGFAASAGPGGAFFWGPLLGAWGGRIVGSMLENQSDAAAPKLPESLAYVKENAPTLGVLGGVGIGLALAATGADPSGGALFWGALAGGIGGGWTGRVIAHS